jgi:DNA polymerase III subunit delta'
MAGVSVPSPRETPHLIGQEAAERAVLSALAGERLHHAWLITGPEGVGKATLAFRFARRLLAGGAGTLEMEQSHPVFRRVAAGSHADLLTVEREWDDKKKKMKKQIAAETVREIPSFMHLTPAEGGWRVVIVDGAEDMSIASANALLKVLEEPPSRAVLMLVSAAPGRLLPTIRSRCRQLALSALGAADMERVLALYLAEMAPGERAALAAMADGAPGRALALAEQGGLKIANLVAEVLAGAPGFSMLRAYEMADALREEDAFELFFTLLRAGIAAAVTAHLRGAADAVQARLLSARGVADWGAAWARLGEIQRETAQHNLERRQAVVAGLSLLQ